MNSTEETSKADANLNKLYRMAFTVLKMKMEQISFDPIISKMQNSQLLQSLYITINIYLSATVKNFFNKAPKGKKRQLTNFSCNLKLNIMI